MSGSGEDLGDFEANSSFDAEGEGAIDNSFEDAERDAREQLEDRLADLNAPTHAEMGPGDIAFDLVQRQPLLVLDKTADSLVEHFEQSDDGFCLADYKQHAWLPVRPDDPVFECVFIGSIEGLHSFSNTYDYPAGRLARVPVELAGGDV